ncbi:type II secretion system protein [Halorarius halobius]|uniref:type II secretion system protein n=1 Tax=Halorarius halobius TaxID=2962671 RepID=UPI0020CF426D|nr:type II secretion system protein [Halorarius halobius]
MSRVGRLAGRLHRVSDPPGKLGDALDTLDVDADAETVTAAADSVAALLAVGTLLLAAFASPRLRAPVLTVGAAVAVGGWWMLAHGPVTLAAARRRRAVGTAPWLVCRAAMRLRVTPTAEAAAAFAGEGDRLLARRLSAHVRRARGTPRTGFERFRAEWGERFPALDRALGSVQAAADAPADEREAALDRALDTILEGVRHCAAEDAAALRGPVTAVYAFGVLLPLALVAALPAAAVAGLPVTVGTLVAGYDVALPLLLVAASAWLVGKRPVAFPAAAVPRSHPEVPDARWPPLVAGLAAAIGAGILAGALLARWAAPVAAAGAGVGTALALRFRHERRVRERIRGLESGLPTVLSRVGRAVTDGQSVERALSMAAESTNGGAGDLLDDAVGRMERLGIGVEAAFLGDRGALADVPSPRAAGVARLLAAATREGRPAGDPLVAAGDHLDALRRVERETRRSVRRLTATMGNTAGLFGPLVGGVTVALAGRMHGAELGRGVAVAALGPVVGWYVLVLAAVLTALAVGLERGFDRAVVGFRVGVALLAATTTYLVAVHATRLVA